MPTIKKIRRSVKHTVVFWFVQVLVLLSNLMPRQSWLTLCGWLGRLAFHVAPKTRTLILQHLHIAFPGLSPLEIKQLSRRVFIMLSKNTGDVLRSTRIQSLEQIGKIMVTDGLENFERATAKGKGVIFVSCHVGAFDLQVVNMALRGLKPAVVGTPLKNKRLNDLLWRYRNAYGAVAIERGKETFRLVKALKSGGSVALLIDQDTKVQNVFVDFFGRPAATPVGATVLAMKTGAAVVPTYVYMDSNHMHHMCILPELNMRRSGDEESDLIYNTQLMTHFIEDAIRQHPDQWVWMHERWKTRPGSAISA